MSIADPEGGALGTVDDPIDLPEPDDSPTGDPPTDDVPPDEPEPLSLVEQLAARGFDVSKYQTEEAAIDGVAEALRLVGRRTEADRNRDAMLATLQEKLGDDGLAAVLEGKPPSLPVSAPAEDKITNERIEVWKAQEQAGVLSETDRARWLKQIQKQQGVANALANRELPEGLDAKIAEAVEKRLQEFTEKQTNEFQAEQTRWTEDNKRNEFYAQHGKELFIRPESGVEGELTALGQQVKQAYVNDPDLQDMPEGRNRLSIAYRLTAPAPTVAKTPLKASRAAQHDPATKGTPKKLSYDEYNKQYPNATLTEMTEYFDT